MTDKLPPNLLKIFAPRPPIPYLAPLDRDEDKRTGPQVSGIASFLPFLKTHDQDYVPTLSLEERRAQRKLDKEAKNKLIIEAQLEKWKPTEDPEISGDPFKTLIISRLSYSFSESELKREFEIYGPIKRVRIVKDKKTGKPRGYAFIEYEREKDMKAAYHEADASRLKGKRVVVDVERGRSVKGWKPRRLGGGLGYTRKGGKDDNQIHSGREASARQRGSEYDRRGDYSRGHDRHRDRRRSRSPDSRYRSRERDDRGRDRDDRYRDRGHERYRERSSERHRERGYERSRDYDRPRDYSHYRR